MRRDRESNGAVAGAELVVLVSVGRHPVTGRARRAGLDARAVEAALSLPECGQPHLLHAGGASDGAEQALRGYLGMGIGGIDVLRQPPQADVVPALEDRLRELAPRLVLCGARSETGEASGLLPYVLAESLGWSVVPGVVRVESMAAEAATVLQALPRGQRRRLRVRLPAILAVDPAARPARQSAYGPACRGEIRLLECGSVRDAGAEGWTVEPARKRPKRLKIVKATSARDRFNAAAAKLEKSGGKVLTDLSPEAAAAEILKFLQEEGVWR
jgi:N,N-dimethylglycine/sarcosine catabolism electron transfer flavoprotein subunit beta